ncbi:MAG TPA: holin family protein [Flavitalea sp.]|nr:holin family protein [Flavitalea sp.]
MNPLLNILGTAIDKIFPDANKRQEAKIKMLELQQAGELTELNRAYDAIIAEAQSQDKWTSRARPSFLYVVYLLILWSIPFSILFAFNPAKGQEVAQGFKLWLAAIPEELWWLMGAGYLGYNASRSYDKKSFKK